MRKEYSMTDSLGGLLDKCSNDIDACIQIHQALDFYISQYEKIAKEKGSLSAVRSYHIELDKEIEIKKTRVPELAKDIKCKMGCDYCCYSNVSISRDEAALMKAAILEDKIVIDMSLLRLQAKNQVKWDDLNIDKKRCVFLDKMGLCKIYKYRPAACRKFLVVTGPELCNLKKDNKVARFVDWHIEVIASAILNGSKSGSLPEMLLEEYEGV